MFELIFMLKSKVNCNIVDFSDIKILTDPSSFIMHDITDTNLPLFVITTSGSTGMPKQVAISNSNFFNFHFYFLELIKSNHFSKEQLVSLQIASLTFDAHVMEILPSLCAGMKIALLPLDKQLDISTIITTISQQKVTHSFIVPSMAKIIADYLDETDSWFKMQSYQMFSMGGEAVPTTLFKKFKQNIPNSKIINGYGPAECTIFSLTHECNLEIDYQNQPPIGKLLPNYNCLVLDDNLNPVLIGSIGHLYIGGAGLFPGYVNQSDLTEKVIVNLGHLHFAMTRAYKTGDLVKLLPTSELLFVGRVDFQV